MTLDSASVTCGHMPLGVVDDPCNRKGVVTSVVAQEDNEKCGKKGLISQSGNV